MKKIFLFFSIFISYYSHAQELYGFDRELQFVSFIEGDSNVIGFGNTWMDIEGKKRLVPKIVIWNTGGTPLLSRNIVDFETINLDGISYKGRIQKAKINPERSKLYILGIQYQGGGREIKSMFHVYDIKKDSFSTLIVDKENQLLDFSFHPSIPNLFSVIYMNKLQELEAGYLEIGKGLQSLGKFVEPKAPLSISFSPDGERVLVGWGSASSAGGMDVFDFQTLKLIRSISLGDHISLIHTWRDFYCGTGINGTYLVDKSTLSLRKKWPVLICNIDSENDLALLKPKIEADNLMVRLFDLNKESTIVIYENICFSYFHFSTDKSKIVGICCKSEFDKRTEYMNGPSARILRVH